MLTYEYDTTYNGSAFSVVEVEVAGVFYGQDVVTLRALVDSGADATMVPLRV